MSDEDDPNEDREANIFRILLWIAAGVLVLIIIGAIFGEGAVAILRVVFSILGALK